MNEHSTGKTADGGPDKQSPDYSKTLYLPQTDFPMRAGLPKKEPEILARWAQMDLYGLLRKTSAGRPKFVLHDGPPYANGNIHIGHALNKILKDLVTRSQQMLGKDSNYVPGWDCHGLPIEWKIEEEHYRKKGKAKPDFADSAEIIAFRKECRAYAEHWVDVQRDEFKRLGGAGDWDHPYSTMSYPAEAQIAREIMKFAANGLLYRGSKPVMWSVVEKTALAEAEVEYEDHVSDAVWVAFPVISVPEYPIRKNSNGQWELLAFDGTVAACPAPASVMKEAELVESFLSARVVIWTTTPWTIPANRAISFNSVFDYALVEATRQFDTRQLPLAADTLTEAEKEHAAISGMSAEKYADEQTKILRQKNNSVFWSGTHRYLVAKSLLNDFLNRVDAQSVQIVEEFEGSRLHKVICAHPLKGTVAGYDFPVPLFDGDHVSDDTGTGFVHTAPGHGRDDFDIWTAHARELAERGIDMRIPYAVDENGFFTDEAPGFGPSSKGGAKRVIDDKGNKGNANEAVIRALIEAGNLLARGRLKHQYPHSWRSKKPLIFRNTPQWFIALDKAVARVPSPHSWGEGQGEGPGDLPPTSPSPQAPHPNPLPAPKSGLPDFGLPNVEVGNSRLQSGERGQVDAPTLRDIALHEIAVTQWYPPAGENRIRGMIANRPDWVVSRQRAWGVPIAVFVKRGTHDVLVDATVNRRIAEAFEAEGADAWFAQGAAARFLSPDYDSADFEKIDDVLDVWFDSGSTHAFTLEDPVHFPGLAGIHRVRDGGKDAIMYLEGSDQHRGWFHSSLLESCGTRARAPYDIVLTHGFTLDELGRKMSKSLGNQTFPQQVIKTHGADILRLWVASVDYSDDQRIGPEILKSVSDNYRKLRNTIRWMLGSLAHYDPQKAPGYHGMDELERLMLHRLAELDEEIRETYRRFDYTGVVARLSAFLNTDLSAFYFDIRKDTLYCEPPSSRKRLAALEAIEQIFRCVTIWLAPILVFTSEEAWLARYPGAVSVHLEGFPEISSSWLAPELAMKWETIRRVRSVVTGALEIERANKLIGSSLEAAPTVYIADYGLRSALDGIDFADVCITSDITIEDGEGPADAFRLAEVPGVAVVPARATGRKCARSWRISPSVGSDPEFPDVTPRDAQALRELRDMGLWP